MPFVGLPPLMSEAPSNSEASGIPVPVAPPLSSVEQIIAFLRGDGPSIAADLALLWNARNRLFMSA